MDAIKKSTLLDKKEDLEHRLESIRKDLARGLNADLKEQAIQLENQDVLLEIARVTEEQIEVLTKKLQQVDETS